MTSIIYKNINVFNAQQFMESVSEESGANVYLTFGKVDSWPDENNPPTANITIDTFYDIWRNMIGAKKLTGNDVSLIFKRNNWVTGTVYLEYDNQNPNIHASNSNMVIVTSDFNVYKCLFNNYNSASTQEPTSINPASVTQTSDGYIWKYMFSISDVGQLKFTTSDYVPIRTLSADDASSQWDVQDSAISGAIYVIKISDGGIGYSNVSNLSIAISGDGSGATASATINTSSNTVNSVTMLSYGTGYSRATVAINGGGGSGAVARAIISPPGGHGSNPVYEVSASHVMLNPQINSSESDILPIDCEYRQIALINNPIEYNSNTTISETLVVSQTMDLVIGSSVDYQQDEYVFQGINLASASFFGQVVSYNSANNLLKLINTYGIPTSLALIGANSTAIRFVTSIDYPALQAFTGEILYVDYISPIIRNVDQKEDFKIVISL